MNLTPFSLALVLLSLAAGCGGSSAAPSATAGTPPSTFADQVALGGSLYGSECASCHGSNGKNGAGPHVVGIAEGALPLDPPAGAKGRTTQFRTVADVAGFVVANMPPGKAGKLTEAQYWAILAFDLKANGIALEQPLDAALAKTLVIPR